METRPSILRRTAVTSAAAALALTASGCATADPEDVEWEKVKTQGIVAIDDSTGVYVTGGLFKTESEQKIDYKFARAVEGGGLRQSMVSDLFESAPRGYNYPGASVVTIHQDVDGPEEKPRIEIYECTPPGWKQCAMPDGSDMGDNSLRVDIHVPKGAVVEPDALTESEGGEE